MANRFGLALLDPPTTYEGVTSLTFRLPQPVDDPRMQLFVWDNTRLARLADLPWASTRTRLRPVRPAKADDPG